MAIMVPSGSVVAAINGTLDGYVYYRGRYGNTIRTWVNPANTITARRTAVRALFASLVSLYNSLTPDMQNDWDVFAQDQRRENRLAQQYIPTGLQVFLERNMNLASISHGPLLLPIPDQANLALKSMYFQQLSTVDFGATAFAWNDAFTLPAGFSAVLYTSDLQDASKTFQYNRWRITQVVSAPSNMFGSFGPAWDATWAPSPRTVGKRIFAKALTINNDTGQATAPVFHSGIIS